MAEQQLDLFQFPAPAPAKLRACSSEIVRPQAQAELVAVANRGGKDGLGRKRVAGNPAVPVQRAQDPPVGIVENSLYPTPDEWKDG